MSVLRKALELRSTVALPDTTAGPAYGASQDFWGAGMVWQGSNPGANSTSQAMRLSSVFACLRLLSEAVSTLPLDTFTRNGGTRKPFRPRPAYLGFQPPQESRIDYLSQVMLSLLTDGNAYVLTPRDRLGVPVDLIVLDPASVTVKREHGQVTYKVGDVVVDPAVDLLHIKGMMLPGSLKGLSPIAYAKETVNLGLAAQRFGAGFFENSALPSAVIEVEQGSTFSKEAADRFRATWDARHSGTGNAQRIGVLTDGAKLTKVSISPEDSQFIQTRSFQVPDIARIFGVPPHLIADASNSTSWGSGLAEQNLAFGQFSLRPWLERIEDAHTRLLTSHGLPDVFIKLNLDSLLRASLTDRYNSYDVGIRSGFVTVNEVRALEDMVPVPWGNEPFVPKKITETGPAPSVELNPPAPAMTRSEVRDEVRDEEMRSLLNTLTQQLRPPTVNVAAPVVTVEAPVVNVEAPAPTSRRVERDANGDIARIVEEP